MIKDTTFNWNQGCINLLPNAIFLDCSKLKAFTDDKIFVTEKMKFVWDRIKIIVGKGENACDQDFFLFPQCFQKASDEGSLKVVIVCLTVKQTHLTRRLALYNAVLKLF